MIGTGGTRLRLTGRLAIFEPRTNQLSTIIEPEDHAKALFYQAGRVYIVFNATDNLATLAGPII